MKAAIAISLVVIVSLAGQTSATKVNQIISVKRTNKLDLEHLIDAISVEIEGTQASGPILSGFYWEETREAPKVVKLLAKTEPKDVVHPLLMFSIDDLLKLNEWTVDDCNDAEFGKRRVKCTRFFTEGRFARGPQQMDSKTKEDLIHYNLGKYCWKLVHDLESKCRLKLIKQALKAAKSSIGFKGALVLSSFESDLKHYITKNDVPADHWKFYKKAVEQVFAASSNKMELKQICLVLVKNLEPAAGMLSSKWTTRSDECSIINNIQVDN